MVNVFEIKKRIYTTHIFGYFTYHYMITTFPIRVVLADDHEIFRDGFRIMLKKQPEVKLVGEAANGEELISLARELQPDVVVTDIKMPRLDGVQATRKL